MMTATRTLPLSTSSWATTLTRKSNRWRYLDALIVAELSSTNTKSASSLHGPSQTNPSINYANFKHFPNAIIQFSLWWLVWSLQGVSEKSSTLKVFWNIFTSVKSFCVKFCKFVDNSYPHTSTNFCRFILIFHQMALIFLRVPIVFTMSVFEYSPIKWKYRGRSPTAWFTQNGWASAVDSTADFLNSAQLPPFVKVTGNYWFCTKSLLTKRLRAQFVVVSQFSHYQA